MRELTAGVWHWQARHPEWQPGQEWDAHVSSYAIVDGDRLLLFDPLDAPAELEERATAVVLTCPWHRRDAVALAQRRGVEIYVPPPDPPDPDPVPGHVFEAGERLPVGVEAFLGREPNDLILWVDSKRALVAGDTLVERDGRLGFPAFWPQGAPAPEQVVQDLQPLLDLPVEHILPTHGRPTDRAALERALQAT